MIGTDLGGTQTFDTSVEKVKVPKDLEKEQLRK